MGDDQVEVAVIIEIGDNQSAAHVTLRKVLARRSTPDEGESTLHIPPQKRRLLIRRVASHLEEIAIGMAIRNDEIGPTIEVEVGQCCPPSDPGGTFGGQAARAADILKQIVSKILVECVVLAFIRGHKQVESIVAIDVGGIDSHPSLISSQVVAGRA